jgi:hypothetical protein
MSVSILGACGLVPGSGSGSFFGGGGDGPGDGPALSGYAAEASQLDDDGIAATGTASQLAQAQHALLALDVTQTDAVTLEAAMDDFVDSLSSYTSLMAEMSSLNGQLHPGGFKRVADPSGADTLAQVADVLVAKQAQCKALFAQVPSLPSSPADFAKLQAAQDCVRQLEAIAAEQSFDTAVSDVGGAAGGGIGGAAVVYFGGTLLSGGGLLVVTVAGVVGSRVVGALWNACKPAPGQRAVAGAGTCAFSHAEGNLGDSLSLQAVGTGTLQVFIEGCAPIVLDGVTLADGQALAVAADCVPLDDSLDPNGLDDASASTTVDVGAPTPTDCGSVVSVTTTTVPVNPAPDDDVTVTAATLPPAAGCTLSYSLAGTDGYTQADSLTTDSSGKVVWTVPAAHQAGIVDTVTTTEETTGASSTISYTF